MNKRKEYSNHRQLRGIYMAQIRMYLLQCFDDSVLFREFEIIHLKTEFHEPGTFFQEQDCYVLLVNR